MGVNDKHVLRISQGKHRGTVKNISISWEKFCEKMREPSVDRSRTYAEYMALSLDEQGPLKSAYGYIVGAQFEDGKRRLTNMGKRSLISFDMDVLTPAQADYLTMGLSDLCRYEFLLHSTRKHCPERPRLRVHLPLKRSVSHDEANAITRIIAATIFATPEESMVAVDVVSFRAAQVAYMPSISRGQEYLFDRNEGILLDPDAVLAAFPGNWRDHTQLPSRPGEKITAADDPSKKMEDPHEKPGLIGAFCRAYTVEEAIEEFLSEVYEPAESTDQHTRYSLIGASTSNGAVVYEDGKFLCSFHASDPIEGVANAWDLVRLHKFGDLDAGVRADTSPSQLPSHKKMVALAEADEKVQAERVSAYRFNDDEGEGEGGETVQVEPAEVEVDEIDAFLGYTAKDFAPGGRLATSTAVTAAEKNKAPTYDWSRDLSFTISGLIRKTRHNCATIICNDRRIAPYIARNEMSGNPVLRAPFRFPKARIVQRKVEDPIGGRGWMDNDMAALSRAISAPVDQGGYGIDFADKTLQQAVLQAAEQNSFNPVLDTINLTAWDGVKRIDTFFIDHLGAADNRYTREVALIWFVAAVARLYEPGHKFDIVPILVGLQGGGKSGLIEVLAMGFGGLLAGVFGDNQKMFESIDGKWVLEVPELKGFKGGEVEDIKMFFTATQDRVRLPYRANPEDFPRRCVFIGTTNSHQFLKDITGNRRFAPILTDRSETNLVDFARLRGEVGQLWAEAQHVYHQMRAVQRDGWLPLYLQSEEARKEHKHRQEEASEIAPHESAAEVIAAWLDTPVPLSATAGGAAAKFSDDGDDDARFVRNLVTVAMIRTELGHNPVIGDLRNMADKVIGQALKTIPGWVPLGNVRRCGLKGRWFVRQGSDDTMAWIEEAEVLDHSAAALLA